MGPAAVHIKDCKSLLVYISDFSYDPRRIVRAEGFISCVKQSEQGRFLLTSIFWKELTYFLRGQKCLSLQGFGKIGLWEIWRPWNFENALWTGLFDSSHFWVTRLYLRFYLRFNDLTSTDQSTYSIIPANSFHLWIKKNL